MTKALVGPLPTITFYGAGGLAGRVRQAYTVPKHSGDLRARLCTDHHPACDCREADLNEIITEQLGERRHLARAARSALAGHQVEVPIGAEGWTVQLCLCPGCVIHRATDGLLDWADVDFTTGRVRTPEVTA